MKTSESIVKIATALLKAQKATGAAKKGASNPFYKSTYADLGEVMKACKEHLNENGITVLQPIMNTVVETILLHESGEWMSSETPIVCSAQNDPQKLGSAISYARRYGLQSMVFIPAEDDDGNSASKTVAQRVATPPVIIQKVPEMTTEDQDVKTFGDCPDCGAPLVEKTKKDGSTFFKCSTSGWDSVNKVATGCPYVDWNNGTDVR